MKPYRNQHGLLSTPRSQPDSGFTLLEVSMAIMIAVVGIISLAGIFPFVSMFSEQSMHRSQVINRTTSLIEEIRQSDPAQLLNNYDGTTHHVTGVNGANADGTAITVTVDASDPRLPTMSVDAAWHVGSAVETMSFQFQMYSVQGQL